MNTNIRMLNLEDISALTLNEITILSNNFATEIGVKTTKRFGTKPAAIKKCLANQSEYSKQVIAFIEANTVVEVEPVVAPKSAKKTGSTFDQSQIIRFTVGNSSALTIGTIEHSLVDTIISLNFYTDGGNEWTVTVADLVFEIIRRHKRPRSEQVVDEAYVIHNIKWFIKKGTLALGQE